MAGRHKLSAAFVKAAPVGKHNDGAGLWLHKRADGGAQWFLRVTIHGRRREMGLGGLAGVSLKNARDLAEKYRGLAVNGVDPIKERERSNRELARADNTLRKIAEEAFEARKAELKGDGKAGRWFSALELHVLPKLGKVPVEEIDARDIRDVLQPLWHSKAETARKAISRLSIVLKHGAALGLDVDLQATEKARALLGKSRHKPKNVPSVPWQKVPAFYASLEEPTLTHLALRLLILTGVRPANVRFLRLEQIEGNVWTIPGELMKGQKDKTPDFRVPLSREALRVIELAKPHARDGYLFPSMRKGVISDATMARLMERRGMKERPHGFRSSLRTWAEDTTDASFEIKELLIAHIVGTKVVRAYQRSDHLEQRRALLERWADHVRGGTGKVLQMVKEQ